MTEAVVRRGFIDVVPKEDAAPSCQPSMGRSKTLPADKGYLDAPHSALYTHTGEGWHKIAEADDEERHGDAEGLVGESAAQAGEEIEDGFDPELAAHGHSRKRTTTECSDSSTVAPPPSRCASGTMGLGKCVENVKEEAASGKATRKRTEFASSPAAIDVPAANEEVIQQLASKADDLSAPPSLMAAAMKAMGSTVTINKTFIEVHAHTPDAHSSGDEEQPSVPRSKTSGEVRSLLAASSSSLPLYVDDGMCWRKTEGATTGDLPLCDDDDEEREDVEDNPQSSIRRQGTSSSGAWEVMQERLARDASWRYFAALQEEQDAAEMLADAFGADVQPQAIWRSVTSDSAVWEGLQEQLRSWSEETGGAAPQGAMAEVGEELRKSAQFTPFPEVCTYPVEDDAEGEGEESEEELEPQRHDRHRAMTEPAAHLLPAAAAVGHAVSETEVGRRKLTAAQRTNRRRAEKRRQRRVEAELESAQQRQGEPSSIRELGSDEWTTVTLRNLPSQYTRAALLEMLDSMGFRAKYDFVYLPLDFQTYAPLGFAFVNFRDPADALRCFDVFKGFRAWSVPSPRECVVVWCAANQQGLESNIERYRNTSLMHASVAEERKPLLLVDGEPAPFPASTRRSWRTPAPAAAQPQRR